MSHMWMNFDIWFQICEGNVSTLNKHLYHTASGKGTKCINCTWWSVGAWIWQIPKDDPDIKSGQYALIFYHWHLEDMYGEDITCIMCGNIFLFSEWIKNVHSRTNHSGLKYHLHICVLKAYACCMTKCYHYLLGLTHFSISQISYSTFKDPSFAQSIIKWDAHICIKEDTNHMWQLP